MAVAVGRAGVVVGVALEAGAGDGWDLAVLDSYDVAVEADEVVAGFEIAEEALIGVVAAEAASAAYRNGVVG